jgi:hypothetical protein
MVYSNAESGAMNNLNLLRVVCCFVAICEGEGCSRKHQAAPNPEDQISVEMQQRLTEEMEFRQRAKAYPGQFAQQEQGVTGQLRKQDEEQIRVIVLKDHITSRAFPNPKDDHKFFFIDSKSDYEKEAFKRIFHTKDPEVIVGTERVLYSHNGTPSDKLTGTRCIVYSAGITYLVGRNAYAETCSYTGNLGAERFEYTLLFTNAEWRIVKKEHGPNS